MSKIKSAKEMFKNWKTFEFNNVVDDEIYVASGNDLKQYADYVLKAKLEGIDVVNVSFLYDFVNQFTDTEIPKKAIKESLDKLKNY